MTPNRIIAQNTQYMIQNMFEYLDLFIKNDIILIYRPIMFQSKINTTCLWSDIYILHWIIKQLHIFEQYIFISYKL